MSVIAVLGDTHFGTRGDSSIFLQNQETFYREVFFPTLDERQITTVVHVGDVFDRRKFVNFSVLNATRRMFIDPLRQRARTRGLHTHVVLGNHDMFFKESFEVTALQELLGIDPAFTLYTQPTDVSLEGRTVLMLPWICEATQQNSLTALQQSSADLVFGHLECAGIEMDRGRLQETGMDVGDLHRFELVLTGHYHHASRTQNVQYLGAPYEMTWADYNSPKGFWILDTNTLALERILNPHRMFYRFGYDDAGKDGDYVTKWVEGIRTNAATFRSAYVKLVVRTKQNPHGFDLIVDAFSKTEPSDISVVEDVLVTSGEAEAVSGEIPLSLDTPNLIDAFLKQAVLRDGEYEPTRAIMMTLFRTATEVTNEVDAA